MPQVLTGTLHLYTIEESRFGINGHTIRKIPNPRSIVLPGKPRDAQSEGTDDEKQRHSCCAEKYQARLLCW
jgi:hypothetical protein